MIEEQEMVKIAALAVKNHFYIIADEIYGEVIYDNHKHVSIALLDKK